MSVRPIGLAWLALVLPAGLAGQQPGTALPSLKSPERLTAVLELRGLGPRETPRVRFEWAPVPGATAYRLTGTVTDRETWRVSVTEHQVTSVNAREWTPTRVSYETPLNPGLYSWKLTALRGPADKGDQEHPAVATFEVR